MATAYLKTTDFLNQELDAFGRVLRRGSNSPAMMDKPPLFRQKLAALLRFKATHSCSLKSRLAGMQEQDRQEEQQRHREQQRPLKIAKTTAATTNANSWRLPRLSRASVN